MILKINMKINLAFIIIASVAAIVVASDCDSIAARFVADNDDVYDFGKLCNYVLLNNRSVSIITNRTNVLVIEKFNINSQLCDIYVWNVWPIGFNCFMY
jgi:hypothetical protein